MSDLRLFEMTIELAAVCQPKFSTLWLGPLRNRHQPAHPPPALASPKMFPIPTIGTLPTTSSTIGRDLRPIFRHVKPR